MTWISEVAMKRLDLSLPEFGFVIMTRAALGTGLGLLLADKLRRKTRRGVGIALVTIGALTTIPAGMAVFGRGWRNRKEPARAA